MPGVGAVAGGFFSAPGRPGAGVAGGSGVSCASAGKGAKKLSAGEGTGPLLRYSGGGLGWGFSAARVKLNAVAAPREPRPLPSPGVPEEGERGLPASFGIGLGYPGFG